MFGVKRNTKRQGLKEKYLSKSDIVESNLPKSSVGSLDRFRPRIQQKCPSMTVHIICDNLSSKLAVLVGVVMHINVAPALLMYILLTYQPLTGDLCFKYSIIYSYSDHRNKLLPLGI